MKNKIRIIILALFLVIFVVIFTVGLFTKDPDGDFSAVICHSVINNKNDKGKIYCYYLYKDKKDGYKYLKTKRSTNNGEYGVETRVTSNKIKNVDSMKKIEKDIEKDNKKNYQSKISCTFVDNGENVFFGTIEELKELLFD